MKPPGRGDPPAATTLTGIAGADARASTPPPGCAATAASCPPAAPGIARRPAKRATVRGTRPAAFPSRRHSFSRAGTPPPSGPSPPLLQTPRSSRLRRASFASYVILAGRHAPVGPAAPVRAGDRGRCGWGPATETGVKDRHSPSRAGRQGAVTCTAPAVNELPDFPAADQAIRPARPAIGEWRCRDYASG